MNYQILMKIFNCHRDLVIIIKHLMLINILNVSVKNAVFTTLDAMYTVISNCCYMFIILSERY